jgi:hypothetical protein
MKDKLQQSTSIVAFHNRNQRHLPAINAEDIVVVAKQSSTELIINNLLLTSSRCQLSMLLLLQMQKMRDINDCPKNTRYRLKTLPR